LPRLQIKYSAEKGTVPTELANIQRKMTQAQQIRRMILTKKMIFQYSSSPPAAITWVSRWYHFLDPSILFQNIFKSYLGILYVIQAPLLENLS
jgi:hypothetical protein